MFKRLIDFHLKKWKKDPFRKPLLLRGARQAGKTYTIRFSSHNYSQFENLDTRPLYAAVSLAHDSQKEALMDLVQG